MVTTTTQRLLDLAAAAPASHDEDLLQLLEEANELYQQGFEDLHRTAAGLPCDTSQDRGELVSLLAVTEWQMTPAALAYSEMAEDAARRGVCLIPEG
ncbi:hypothetical protein [Streptomyces mirabilis]|uniref:hypothetical protein n=1 Tax=Streptomyces mirabilis TaxID=68239 RepID=UPI003680B255